jgi:hypothetical protein
MGAPSDGDAPHIFLAIGEHSSARIDDLLCFLFVLKKRRTSHSNSKKGEGRSVKS